MLLISPSKTPKPKPTRTEERDEMFILPPLKEEEINKKAIKSELEDEDDDDFCPKRAYDVNINKIDVTSSHFKSLPADIRHDILTDIRETRKQNTWGRLRELPVESNDFSTYQMSRLLRRRQVQIGLEQAEKEMGGKTFSLSELESLLSEDGVLEVSDKCAQKIASDENTRFLLVRDIAMAMNNAKTENVAGPSTSQKSEPQPSTSSSEVPQIDLEDDDDLELQRAIQLSLGNDPDDEVETVEQSNDIRKMNPEQRQKFSGTIQAHGLIRGFMMEYAEMNTDDIQDLIESTQAVAESCLNDSYREKFPNTDEYVLYGTPEKNQSQDVQKSVSKSSEIETGVISESESEDDLIEIKDKSVSKNDSLVITVAPEDYKLEEDLFADVFEKKTEEVPDVEVASISSDDDDTLPYEIPQKDFEEIAKESESGFVSEEGKVQEKSLDSSIISFEEFEAVSENDKFWSSIEEPVTAAPVEPQQSPVTELSENEKFWADEAIEAPVKIIEIKTPVKATREHSPPPAKVVSPFFVNRKTPSSKKKTSEDVEANSSSVAKALFPTEPTGLEKAAQELRTVKTSQQLVEMKDQLVDQQKNLAQERNKLDRMGTSITESMSRDCKDLLKLFGIPYIDSPMEAEAQCAFLNMIELTDGSISDDSDIWLFGGQTVYKNFFVQKKIVMEFRNENIEEMFHLDRKKLIQLAMLVGSDYTVGINGIGAVTALEILAAFPPTPETDGTTDQYQSLVSSLRKFREWFQNGKQPGAGGKTVLKSKLKNVELFEGFPNLNVAKAYLEPIVDQNAEKFSWGMPDSESLVEYAKAKLGWTRMKTEEILEPVMKRLNEKKQATIKDYFKSQVTKKFFDSGKMSKRVQKAVGKMGGEEEEEEEPEEKPKKTRKRKAPVKKAEKKEIEEATAAAAGEIDNDLVLVLSDDEDTSPPPEKKSSPETPAIKQKGETSKKKNDDDDAHLFKKQTKKITQRKVKESEPSTSSAADDDVPTIKRVPRIPNTVQVIPQREKDKEEREKAKQKAIEVFKKSKEVGKKK